MHATDHPGLRLMVFLAALLQLGLAYLVLSQWMIVPPGGRTYQGGRG